MRHVIMKILPERLVVEFMQTTICFVMKVLSPEEGKLIKHDDEYSYDTFDEAVKGVQRLKEDYPDTNYTIINVW